MLSISSAIAGHDMMQIVAPTIPNGFWFATPENEWKGLFWRHLPRWLTSDDLSSLRYFYRGDTTFYTEKYLRDWLRPILWWTVFLTVLIWVVGGYFPYGLCIRPVTQWPAAHGLLDGFGFQYS